MSARSRTFSEAILGRFDEHEAELLSAYQAKRQATTLSNVAVDKEVAVSTDVWETLGKRQPSDRFLGCVNLRTLRTLLKMIDERGFERSDHQLQFHSAFERCVSRVVYKSEWGKDRTAIMQHNGWEKCSSEVMISTPRRFGKTFSIAIFVACLSLSFGCECVIFSPARRASRKLLERICEFVKLLQCDERILEYNQENLRLNAFNGRPSLIRSFPSKVGVEEARPTGADMRFQSSFASAAVVATKRARAEITPSVGAPTTQPTQPDGTFTPSATPREDTASVHLKGVHFRQEVDVVPNSEDGLGVITTFIDLEFQRTLVPAKDGANAYFVESPIRTTTAAFKGRMTGFLLDTAEKRNNIFIWEDMSKRLSFERMPVSKKTATNNQTFTSSFMIQTFVTAQTASMVQSTTNDMKSTYWQFPAEDIQSPYEFMEKMLEDKGVAKGTFKIKDSVYKPSVVVEGFKHKINLDVVISGLFDTDKIELPTSEEKQVTAKPTLSFSMRKGKGVKQLLAGAAVEDKNDKSVMLRVLDELAFQASKATQLQDGKGVVWKQAVLGSEYTKAFVMIQMPLTEGADNEAVFAPEVQPIDSPLWNLPTKDPNDGDKSLLGFLRSALGTAGDNKDPVLKVVLPRKRNGERTNVEFEFLLDASSATPNKETNVLTLQSVFQQTTVEKLQSGLANAAKGLFAKFIEPSPTP